MSWALARLILGQICIHAGMRMAAPLMALREGHSAAALGAAAAVVWPGGCDAIRVRRTYG